MLPVMNFCLVQFSSVLSVFRLSVTSAVIVTWFTMAALWNRAGHYIFALWFISSFFLFFFLLFSSPNLSGRRLDVYRTSTHGVALARI